MKTYRATCPACEMMFESEARGSIMMAVLLHVSNGLRKCQVNHPAEIDAMITVRPGGASLD